MSSHTANKTLAVGGMIVAIGVGAIVFVVNSRHDAAGTKAPMPQLAAAVAPTARSQPDAAPTIDDFVGSAVRTPASAPAAATATEPAVAPVVGKPKAPEVVARIAPNHVIIHDVPVSEPASRAPDVASALNPLASPKVLKSSPRSVRPDPMKGAVLGAGAIDDAAADRRITAGVKTAIAADSQLSTLNIGVTSLHGNVTLSGHLATQNAIDHARDVARPVSGVLSVDTSAMVVASL